MYDWCLVYFTSNTCDTGIPASRDVTRQHRHVDFVTVLVRVRRSGRAVISVLLTKWWWCFFYGAPATYSWEAAIFHAAAVVAMNTSYRLG